MGKNLYSTSLKVDDITCEVEWDSQDYKVTFVHSKEIEQDDQELKSFQAIVFKEIMKKMDFERDGRSMLMPAKAAKIENLQVWPGFFTSMQHLAQGSFIQIDLTSKVIRQDNLLDHLENLQRQGKSSAEINEEMQRQTVVTLYGQNSRTHTIESIDFEKSPMSTFPNRKEKKDTTFCEYYSKQYNISVRNKNQPMVICKDKKTGQEIALLPELCNLTGLTDGMRANFQLMKQLSGQLHKSGQVRLDQTKQLMSEIQNQQKVKEFMEEWDMELGKEPLKVNAQRIDAGQIVMGSSRFDANTDSN